MVRRRSILKEPASNNSSYIGDATELSENQMNNTFGVNTKKPKRRVSFNNSMFVRPIAKVGHDPADFEGVVNDYQQPTYFKSAEENSADYDGVHMPELDCLDQLILRVPKILATLEEQSRENQSLDWGSATVSKISSIGLPSEDQSSPMLSFLQLKPSSSVGSVCGKMKSLNVDTITEKPAQMETVSATDSMRISPTAMELSEDNDAALVSFLLSPPLPVEMTQGDDLNKSCMPLFREPKSPPEALKSSEDCSILAEISESGPETNVTENISLSQNLKKMALSSNSKVELKRSETVKSEEQTRDKELSFLNYSLDKAEKTQAEILQSGNVSKIPTTSISDNLSDLFASPIDGDKDSENKENVPVSESSKFGKQRGSVSINSTGRVWPPKAINLSDRSVSPLKKSPLDKLKSLVGNQVKPGSGIMRLAAKNLNYEWNDARTCSSTKPVPIFVERFGAGSFSNKDSQDVVEQMNFERTFLSRTQNVTVIDEKLPEEKHLDQDSDLKTVETFLARLPEFKEIHWPKFDSCKVLGCLKNFLEITCLADVETFGESRFVPSWKDLDEGAETKLQDVLKKFNERQAVEKRLKNLKSQASNERYLNIDAATSIFDYIWHDKENVEFVYDNSLQVNIKFNKPQMKTTEFTVVKLPGSSKYHKLFIDGACKILLQPEYTIGYSLSDVLQFTIEFLNKSLLPIELCDSN